MSEPEPEAAALLPEAPSPPAGDTLLAGQPLLLLLPLLLVLLLAPLPLVLLGLDSWAGKAVVAVAC